MYTHSRSYYTFVTNVRKISCTNEIIKFIFTNMCEECQNFGMASRMESLDKYEGRDIFQREISRKFQI